MSDLTYTLPSLNKGKTKWLIRYTLKVNEISEYRKEVGSTYRKLIHTLNSKEFKVDGVFPEMIDGKVVPANGKKKYQERLELANTIIDLLKAELADGVDPENSQAGYAALKQRKIDTLKEFTLESNLDFYYKKAGLSGDNVPDRKKDSAYNLKMFFKNQFVPYFKEKGLDDIRLITKQHIRIYLDYYFEHSDKKLKWSFGTTNTRKGWIAAFFSKLVEYDILTVNPCSTISRKPDDGTGRGDYKIFSEKEVAIIFDTIEKKTGLLDKRLEVFMKILYYAYIRKAEMRRITMKHIDLEGRKFRMTADISKKSNDGKVFTVLINPLLQPSMEQWIKQKGIDISKKDALLFANPNGEIHSRNFLESPFNTLMKQIRKENPDYFKEKGQTIYSMKSSGVTHLFHANKHRPNVLHFIKDQCRHQSITTTEIYLKKIDCQLNEIANFSFFSPASVEVE